MRSRILLALLFMFGLWLLAGPQAERVEAKTPREQKSPAVAYNSHPDIRSFFLVWIEDRGAGPDIYGKRLFNNGLPQGGPAKSGIQVIRQDINRRSDPPGPRADPAMVYNPQREEFLMVFSEYAGETEGWDVFAVRINSAGYAVGNPRLIAGGPGDQQHPDVELIEDEDGQNNNRDYFVVFDDNARDIDEVWAVRLRSNSIPSGKPYVLVRDALFNAVDPTTNGAVVAWVDDRDGQSDIWALRLRNGKPNGMPYRLAGDRANDDFAPRYGQGGLVWSVFDPVSGVDIQGARVYQNDRTRGSSIGILVPAADQSWPDRAGGPGAQEIVVFADNRSGEFDLYAVRTSNFLRRGREFPVLSDFEP